MDNIRKRKEELERILRLLPWTIRLLWCSHWQATLIVSGLTFLQGIVPVGQLWIMKLLVDQIVLVITSDTGQRPEQAIKLVFMYLLLEAGVLLAGVLVSILSGHAYNVLGEHLTLHIQSRILDQCTRLDLQVYESPEYYDILQRAQDQANQGPMLLLRRLIEFAQSALTLSSVVLLIIFYKPWLALILFVVTIPAFVINLYYGRQRFHLYDHRTPMGRRASYLGYVLSTDEYAKEVRIWGLTNYFKQKFHTIRTKFRDENIHLSQKQSIAGFCGEFISTTGYYISYVVVILEVISGSLTIGDLTLYSGAFSRYQSLLESLLESVANIYEIQLFTENLALFLSIEPSITNQLDAQQMPALREGLSVESMSFVYPETDTKVLDNISFTIKPGECVAIVGHNGAGKTTLVKLLLRLYEPTEGRICIDDLDIRDIDLDALRMSMGVVFQDYARYHMTARENIGFGDIGKIDDKEAIQRAAKEAGIDGVIERFPEQYETSLGRQFAGGHELSLGQWQRIAVARALLRDAPILILDEPTAAMDAQAEYELYQQLHSLAQGRMTILISHRFSTVRMADRILVLEHGRIIEEGTHDELMARDSRYAYFFRLQAENYQLTPVPDCEPDYVERVYNTAIA